MKSGSKGARGAGFILLVAGAVGGAALLARCAGDGRGGPSPGGAEDESRGRDAPGRARGVLDLGGGTALDLRLAARAAIAGVVRERDAGPVAGATVCAWPQSDRLSAREARARTCAQAGPDGRYRLDGLLPVRQVVRAAAPGFLPGVHERPGALGPRRDLGLSAGQELTGVDILLDRGGVEVRGVVRDLSGGEVPGAEVQSVDAFAVAGDDGAFALWVLPGELSISARADGYAEGQSHGVAPGHDFQIFLIPEAVLLGQVVRASDGAPVEGAKVYAEGESFVAMRSGSAFTGADGRFRIDGLEPGAYKAIAEADDAYGVADAQVVLGLGETSQPVVVRAHPAFHVDGRVEPLGGGACEGGWVRLHDPAGGRRAHTAVDASGAARLGGLLPGAYEVSVECEGMIAEERYDPVVIDDRSVDGLRWKVRPGRTIRGVVVDASGAPAPRLHIAATPQGAGPRAHKTVGWGDETRRDGSFAIGGLLPGAYELRVFTWRAPRAAPEPLVVTVSEGEDLSGVRIEIPATGEVRGRVRDPRGRGLGGVDVRLRGGRQSLTARTADDGTFRLEHAAPGDYRAVAYRVFEPLRAPGSTDDDLHGERVSVKVGEVAEIDLVVEPSDGTIRGVVRDEGGGLVADAFIEASRESESAAAAAGGAARAARWGSFLKPPLLTDAGGSFTVDGLASGKYTLRAHRRGGGEGVVEHVEVGADVTVTIAATAELAGVVVTPGGEAPERFTVSIHDAAAGVDRSDQFFRTGGAWRLPEVPAGKYKVRVDAPTGAAEIDVSLQAGEDQTGLRVELTPRVTVRGQVVDLDGAPVAGYRVLVATGGAITFPGDGGDKRDVTDVDGRFEVERAPAGVVRISLIPEDMSSGLAWTVVAARIPAGEPVYEAPPIQVTRPRVARGEVAGDLGFTLKDPPPDADPLDSRLEVAVVRRGGPAAKAGLRPGDVIVSIDGHDVRGASAHLYRGLTRVKPGVALRLGLERGVTLELSAGAPP